MADDLPPDRSTPRRPRKPPQEQPPAPAPLLLAMASLIVILLIVSWLAGQWQYMFLGIFGVAAGLVPFISRRR